MSTRCVACYLKVVDQMLATQEQLNSTLSDSDKKFLQQRVDILDKQINTVVYGLYGLTADEGLWRERSDENYPQKT